MTETIDHTTLSQPAAYDAWQRAQVQASIDDPRPSVSDEDARTLFTARKEELRKAAN